jgi:flavin-dependent dehydrogenase
MTMSDPHDVVVLGATPAGYVAAITLAQRKHDVVLVAAPAAMTESPLADWVPADVIEASPVIKSVKTAFEGSFKEIVYHSQDFSQQAEFHSRSAAGYFIRQSVLLEALAKKAKSSGVKLQRLSRAPRIRLQENSVILTGEEGTVEGSVLLICQDDPDAVMTELIMPLRISHVEELSACGLDVPVPRTSKTGALHLVTYGSHEQMGMFFQNKGLLHVRMLSADRMEPAGVEQLSHFIAQLQQAKLLPEKLNLAKAAAAIWHPPGGVALELETHLAKRTLLVGTAGGFVSVLSGQSIDPSIRSAVVAAEVTHKALRSKQVQETLAEYKRHWRDELSDRIRLPGTSLKMLLPIIYSNKAMAAKFARTLLYGAPI